jgi:hypothetical protein
MLCAQLDSTISETRLVIENIKVTHKYLFITAKTRGKAGAFNFFSRHFVVDLELS